MFNMFLTSRNLGGLFLISTLMQVIWWGSVAWAHRDSIDLTSLYDTWWNAPIYGKLFFTFFLIIAPAMYVRSLWGLGRAGQRLLVMSDHDFRLLRMLEFSGWRRCALFNLVPPAIIVFALTTYGVSLTGPPGAPPLSGFFFGALCFVLCFGYTAFPFLHVQKAEQRRKESNIDHVIEFL